MKLITKPEEWGDVAGELEREVLKLKSYDEVLLPRLGDVAGKSILDYGHGPGLLLEDLANKGASVKGYDLHPRMRDLAAQRVGAENIYDSPNQIPNDSFDAVICNLVTCINSEESVNRIATDINRALRSDGVAYIGFCNPHIFDVEETALDLRQSTKHRYDDNHDYLKIKKEGTYAIIEKHRPIEWYQKLFETAGLQNAGMFFTPPYEMNGRTINDFVILKVQKRPTI